MEYRDEVYFDSQPENEAPFSEEEFASRLTRLRRRMADAQVDTLYLMAPESMYYLTGYQAEWYQAQSPPQWPAASAVAVHVDHDYCIRFDSEREAVLGRIHTRVKDVRFFPRSALRGSEEFVASELKRAGWLNGTVGMEFWSYRPNRPISHRLEDAFVGAGARVVDATMLLREVRHIKSPAEIECLKEAARIANLGMATARATIGHGVTELEVYGEMIRTMARAGGENPGITMPVLSGNKTNALHGVASRHKMQRGDMVLVDLSGVFKRYHINMARSFCIGEPSAEVRDLTTRAARSMDLIRSLLRPGLPVREFNAAVLDYYRREKLWERRGWVGGYEMGVAFPPDWVGNFVFDPAGDPDSADLFLPRTAVNYENQFFMPDHRGQYFTIDSWLFEDDKATMLSEQPFELIAIG